MSGHTSGFTIIELLIVLAIAVGTMAVVGPNLSAGVTSVKFKGAARDIASALRYTRSRAISENTEAEFFIDVNAHVYRVSGKQKRYTLPDDIQLSLFTAESELTGDGQGNIRFFPDGSSTGGRVTLQSEKRKRLIDVNWLTGQITLSIVDELS